MRKIFLAGMASAAVWLAATAAQATTYNLENVELDNGWPIIGSFTLDWEHPDGGPLIASITLVTPDGVLDRPLFGIYNPDSNSRIYASISSPVIQGQPVIANFGFLTPLGPNRGAELDDFYLGACTNLICDPIDFLSNTLLARLLPDTGARAVVVQPAPAVPLPAALPLSLAGLAMLTGLGLKRRRG